VGKGKDIFGFYPRLPLKFIGPDSTRFHALQLSLLNPGFQHMKIKSYLARPFAGIIRRKILRSMETAVADQEQILMHLLKKGASTLFGKEHQFSKIADYEGFKQNVPLRDYEKLRNYIEQIKEGEANVLWPGKPIYLAKTSGTTSGAKYIPITKDSIPNHIDTARNALLNYIALSGNADFASGNMIFLSGSPTLERIGGIPTGRLSGIVHHHIPGYLRKNNLPSFETNCIDDWETKLNKIVDETISRNMTLISGIPPWIQMYFDRLTERSGKKIGELFPEFSLLVYGGVNFSPYRSKLMDSIGRKIDTLETFPASEGFFAFQDTLENNGLLLNTNSGIFFEFVPANEIFNDNPTRLSLRDVKIGENYALIVNNNAGLWGYNIGDTVKFVSTNPYRLVVTGRIKHFISAFGEHVIGEEVDYSLMRAAEETGAKVIEFTVAPFVAQEEGASYHEWFVEFEETPDDLQQFSRLVDHYLRSKNMYYDDLIKGNILHELVVRPLKKGAFIEYMKMHGKLGGQNKVPRLSNDRTMAEELEKMLNKQ